MSRDPSKLLRCAVYTRVSTEHGLEQEFNSLDNQREAAEAYIRSQAHEGWRLHPARYDDGGFSGGSMDRPALQRLLADIKAGQIDIVVVYKVDRLTQSLADFAKLVELFDAHGVSFVSVTQSFNTTSSMGRLTLNVLLSFAQFEREVTGERIRDKIAASKRKGLWMGGVVPLGYRVSGRALHIVDEQGALVRELFSRDLALGSVTTLKRHLDQSGIRVPERVDGAGRRSGGGRFSRGHLYKLLANPIYIGAISHKGRTYPGQHPAIVDQGSWDAVQARLAEQAQVRKRPRLSSESLLVGRIRDDRGHTMTPTHAQKGARRYRYYVSQAVLQGRVGESGSVARVPAPEVEAIVVGALRSHVDSTEWVTAAGRPDGGGIAESDAALVARMLDDVVVGATVIDVMIRADAGSRTIPVPWTSSRNQRRREIVLPNGFDTGVRPIRAEARATLLHAIARGRAWLDELVSGQVSSMEAIAVREGCSERSVRMMLSLASLAPDIVQAANEGRLPRGIGLSRLTDLPLSWSEQRAVLGFSSGDYD